MNICLICCEYPPAMHGGIGTMTKDLAEGLVREGHHVVVCGIYDETPPFDSEQQGRNENGVIVYRFYPKHSQQPNRLKIITDRLYLARMIVNLHGQYQFDLIESPDYGGMLAIGHLPKVPLIVRLHGASFYFNGELIRKTGRLVELLEKRQLTRANKVISVSKYVAHRTFALLKHQKDYSVIYNAVDVYNDMEPHIVKQKGLIIFTGSVIPKKGIAELVNSMLLVFSQNDQAHLLVIGKDLIILDNGQRYSDYLLDKMPTEFADRITFMGWCNHSEINTYLRKAEVCVFPSHAEAFAIAPLEAMSVGAPVVFMQSGSGPETIEDGVSGLLCDTHDPQDIAEKILVLLNDQDYATQMGNAAKQRVQKLFNKQNWIGENIREYHLILSKYGNKNA